MLLLKYFAAVFVACIFSCFIMAVGSGMLVGIVPFLAGAPRETQDAAFCVAYLGAFCGVFAGTFCLLGHDRRLASVALGLIGIGFYLAWSRANKPLLAMEYGGTIKAHPLLLPLACGAATAVVVTVLTCRKPRPLQKSEIQTT